VDRDPPLRLGLAGRLALADVLADRQEAAMTPIVAQSAAEISAVTVISALLVLYVVSTIAGMFRRPSMAAVFNIAMLFGVMYVGWSIARWPGNDPSEGMLLGLFHAWLDSLRTIWDLFYDISGLDSVVQRLGITSADIDRGVS
jgi:hypothetical protein